MTTRNPDRQQTPSQVARSNRLRLAAEDGAKAMADAAKTDVAVRKNMQRLREMRLAREASTPAQAPAAKKPRAVKSKAKAAQSRPRGSPPALSPARSRDRSRSKPADPSARDFHIVGGDEHGDRRGAHQLVERAKTCSAVCTSRLPVGSSARRMRGALATARAMATRCCSPPDSSAGRCVSRSLSPR